MILATVAGESTKLRIARPCDVFHHMNAADLEVIRHKAAVLDDWCAKLGRDPQEIERCIILDPKALDQVEHSFAAGFSHVNIRATAPDYDMGALRELLQWRDSIRT